MTNKIKGVEVTDGVIKGAGLVDHIEAIPVTPIPIKEEEE